MIIGWVEFVFQLFLFKGVNFLRTKELTSLSEQQLLDCCGKKGHNCEGCQGGWPEQAISYVKE